MNSSTPLLISPTPGPEERCLATGAMATADVPTRPEQLQIHNQPGITAQDSVSSPSSGTKVNREFQGFLGGVPARCARLAYPFWAHGVLGSWGIFSCIAI